jgi:hypothetical protein
MILHSIISEYDIFYMPEIYMKNGNESAMPANTIPCITDPSLLLMPQLTNQNMKLSEKLK